ncbi:lipoprotein signal peptidase [Jannaschia pagri]|uniref:Lipoprotein signal peptidase n=1 Tax=Jannaschia pagri TaxID=2829797 RepID=A0ABQ4NK61_9RHOB|nr:MULTISPECIES: signal peptidase II [unclassified Jannaschia]GIT90961.1 lipoprotein signal peptidase [Jannaschia sp. AI_61]GIT94793.1 lipoprotein signal peptidase [Jannaschia sp. AI_62]
MRALGITALLAFAIDQLSKLIVVHWMNLKEVLVIPVVPPLLTFRMGWNEGINFGLFSGAGARWALVGLALAISVVLIVWARKFDRPISFVAAGLVIGGALGNALDRVVYGAVADFLNMSCCGVQNPFAFNIADVFIFAGAFGLVIWGEPQAPKNTP